MDQLTCCKGPSWAPERDLGHAESFDYLLGKCTRCGSPWMNVFCVASGITGYERVKPDDLARIRATPDGPELKELMRQWGRENL